MTTRPSSRSLMPGSTYSCPAPFEVFAEQLPAGAAVGGLAAWMAGDGRGDCDPAGRPVAREVGAAVREQGFGIGRLVRTELHARSHGLAPPLVRRTERKG